MEPPEKRIKLSSDLQESIIKDSFEEIARHLRKSDVKNIFLLNSEFYDKMSFHLRDLTYLYIHQEDCYEVLKTARQFNEIFFHGNQEEKGVGEILKKIGGNLKILSFGKCDLNFMKVSPLQITTWLNYASNITKLNTVNIHLTKMDLNCEKSLLENLIKLKCDDSILSFIKSPKLEKLKVFTTDNLTEKKRVLMNNFFENHHNIKYISYTIYNSDDPETQRCEFNLCHLKLTHMRFCEFRYDINAVINIIKDQKNLIDLKLEDGAYNTESFEDSTRVSIMHQNLYPEILKLEFLQKLYIEMPSDEMMQQIPLYFEHLKTLKICSITTEMLETFQLIRNDKIEKLCIENLEHGKKHLLVDNIKKLSRSYPNLTSFKADTLPPAVMNAIVTCMKKLKKLKIIRNEYLPQKMKKTFNEIIQISESKLDRITCKYEDYKLRILPLIQASPHLKHVKIYWDSKHTPFMQIIFEILFSCREIQLIDFSFDGVYIKANIINLENFNFSYNNREFEINISRKKGKIICKKIN